jgi:hypothetical protein
MGDFEEMENRFEPSFFLNTDFILVTYLLRPFFSAGVSGTSARGALMLIVWSK